jgi:hypothetical protein
MGPLPVFMPVISQPSQLTLPQHARHRLRGIRLAKLIEKATNCQLLRDLAHGCKAPHLKPTLDQEGCSLALSGWCSVHGIYFVPRQSADLVLTLLTKRYRVRIDGDVEGRNKAI